MVWKKRSIETLSKTEYDRCISLMAPTRRKKVLAMNGEARRKAAVLGEWMVKTMLAEKSGLPVEKITLSRTEKGKPYAEGLPHFSISHSGEWVVAVVSENPVGIDIEQVRPIDPRLAERIGADPERFFEEWTAKEAYFKIHGDPNFKNISYSDLSPLHFYEGDYIITIIKEEK